MRAFIFACALCGALWLPAFAQRGGGGAGGGAGRAGGLRGFGFPRPVVQPIPPGTTGIPPLGAIPPIGSLPPFGRRAFGRFGFGGYGYPGYIDGGYYGSDYGQDGVAVEAGPYQANPDLIELLPEGSPAHPRERPAQGVVHDYTKANLSEPAQGPPAEFSIVGKNHVAYPAVAVWAQEGKLHYIGSQGGAGVIPIGDVDRAATEQANNSKGLHLQIPAD